MYHAEAGTGPDAARPALDRAARRQVPRQVYLLGAVSLLTDVSSEMVASVLPLYLFMVLRLSPLEYGLVDGLFNGSAALVRVWFAHWADRAQQHKRIAFLGYALSALSRVGLFVAGLGGWISVAAVLLLDRIGKGIRTAPRDALIAQCSEARALGASFGVHRAMDAVGALAGPLLATALLLLWPQRFDVVFAASVVFAVAGLVVLARWVRAPAAEAHAPGAGQAAQAAQATETAQTGQTGHTARTAHVAPHASPGSAHAAGLLTTLRRLGKAPFLALCCGCTALATFTVSDGMVYSGLQARGWIEPAYLPMMFVATAAVFILCAIPVGRVADRVGPMKVFAAGHAGLAALYAAGGLQWLPMPAALVATAGLMGLYYAATDGVVMALVARHLPHDIRTTAMAVVTSVIGLARMASSVAFGWCWTRWSYEVALGLFAAGLLASLLLTLQVMARWWPATHPSMETAR